MTLPSIPDTTYKFLLYLGLILIGYSFLKSLETVEKYNLQVEKSNSYIDSLTIKEIYKSQKKEKLKEISSELSKIYDIKNPITVTDTTTSFNLTLKGNKEEIYVTDSLRKIWDDYQNSNFEMDLLSEKIRMTQAKLDIGEDNCNQSIYFFMALGFLGIILAIGGFFGMEKIQKMQEKLLELDISTKDVNYKFCQSCGKNYTSIRKKGRNENGEVNDAFCIDCFDNGVFKNANMTLEDFQNQANDILKNIKNPREKTILKERFKSLERWKINDYF